jgi:hypothetical protein
VHLSRHRTPYPAHSGADIAEQRWQIPPKKATSARCPPGFGIAGLAAYPRGEGAKTLEQKELDPVLPDLGP